MVLPVGKNIHFSRLQGQAVEVEWRDAEVFDEIRFNVGEAEDGDHPGKVLGGKMRPA